MWKLSRGEEKARPEFLSSQAFQSLFDYYFSSHLSKWEAQGPAKRLLICLLTPADSSASPGSDYLHHWANLSGRWQNPVSGCGKGLAEQGFLTKEMQADWLGFWGSGSSAEQRGWSRAARAMHEPCLGCQPPSQHAGPAAVAGAKPE